MSVGKLTVESVGDNSYRVGAGHQSTGGLLAQALAVVYETVPGGFTPHSIHSLFNDFGDGLLAWTVDRTSEGKNFVNRAITARQNDRLVAHANCSFTSRNSYTVAASKYKAYTELIAQRRLEGKTEDDDDEDDILRVEIPLRIKAPYPDAAKNVDIGLLARIDGHGFDLRILSEDAVPALGPGVAVYDRLVYLFARVDLEDLSSRQQFVRLAQLTDAVNAVGVGNYVSTQRAVQAAPEDRVVWFHDDSFDVSRYLTFQVRLVRATPGTIVVEAEVFNHEQVHVASVAQESRVLVSRL